MEGVDHSFARRAAERIAESVVLLALFPVWLVAAITARGAGAACHRRRRRGSLRAGMRRWAGYITGGLALYRRSWWIHFRYERVRDIWHHVLLVEWFSALNQAGRPVGSDDRFLVVKLAHFGDALHVGPMVRRLRAARPGSVIDAMVGPWSAEPARRWDGVSNVLTYVPHYLLFNRGNRQGLRRGVAELRFLHALRRARYDIVLSTSTMNLPEWLLIQAAFPALWVGAGDPVCAAFGDIEERSEPYASRDYEADRVAGLLRHLGIQPETAPPYFRISDEEDRFAVDAIARARGRHAGPVVVIAPGAGWPGKIWPPERFGEVACSLAGSHDAVVILVGAPSESSLSAEVVRGCPEAIDLVGRTTLGQAAALIRRADLLVCNDSGPLHFAACHDTPSLALFGPTVASKWAPRGERHRLIQKSHDCRGCISWHPATRCVHDGACMKAITVDDVVCEACDLLDATQGKVGTPA